ncbi:MAG: amidase [Myxococcales bacterium]
MNDLIEASASDLAAAIRARSTSSLEVVDAFLARIRAANPALNAIVTLDEEGARRQARGADAALAHGEVWGPLHGVPITLKDGHATAGLRTTAGHVTLAKNVPAFDGVVAARMKRAGAILLGKTNVSSMLMDIQADNAVFGRTNNPYNLERTSGGSSGGAAAALAARMTPLDIGSDFAGSIRIPAHFCGVYGLKPTEGRVPLTGHIPEPSAAARTPSMWSAGPLARSIDDLYLALQIISGPEQTSPDVAPVPVPEIPKIGLNGLHLAWTPTFPGVPVAKSIRDAVAALAKKLSERGAIVEERLPHLSWEEQAKVRVKMCKALDPAGASMPAGDYLAALDRRAAIVSAWERFFGQVEAFICPVAMVSAFEHCPTDSPLKVDGEQTPYWRIVGHCAPFNLTGHPVLVVPIGRDEDGLPIGIQLVTRRWNEGRLLAIGRLISGVVGSLPKPERV